MKTNIDDLTDMVMRQTNYTYDESLEKIKYHNFDIVKVINEYLGVMSKPKKNSSTNQMMYSEFRKFLDDASEKHRIKKENEKEKEKE
jgi:hypothetical protein